MTRYNRIAYAAEDGGGAPPPPAPGGATPPPPAGTPWHQGHVDAETLGHWQNKGWDISDPIKVATAATKAHQEAERHIGVPADQLLRMPKGGDEAATKAFWQRLGAPADAAGYDFADVKFADGTPLDDNFVAHLRGEFSRLNLPKDTAAEVTKAVVKFMEGAETSEKAEATASLAKEQASLRENWGRNFDGNQLIARRAAEALKVTPAELDALEKVVGGARAMEMFRSIGERMGEARFVSSTSGNGSGVMSREHAASRLAELKADRSWTAKYLDGDATAKREMNDLLTIMHGDDTRESQGY